MSKISQKTSISEILGLGIFQGMIQTQGFGDVHWACTLAVALSFKRGFPQFSQHRLRTSGKSRQHQNFHSGSFRCFLYEFGWFGRLRYFGKVVVRVFGDGVAERL